jgi:MFS family permease
MASFLHVLKNNRNYRYTWMGQVVSEIGDHFNNIAVFSLVLANTHSGLAVSGVMLSRAVPAVLAGPIAGVLLDRLDRKKVMIASDLVRFVVALGFILTVDGDSTASLYLLYALSAVLMFASPFFTSGRAAILPTITTREEMHTANSITQTTAWATLTIGTFTAGRWGNAGAALALYSGRPYSITTGHDDFNTGTRYGLDIYAPISGRLSSNCRNAGTTVAGSGRSEMSSPGNASWCMTVRMSPGSTLYTAYSGCSTAKTLVSCSSAAFDAP